MGRKSKVGGRGRNQRGANFIQYTFLLAFKLSSQLVIGYQEWWWPENGVRPDEDVPDWAHGVVLSILIMEMCVGKKIKRVSGNLTLDLSYL